jgi:hypothetical protein
MLNDVLVGLLPTIITLTMLGMIITMIRRAFQFPDFSESDSIPYEPEPDYEVTPSQSVEVLLCPHCSAPLRHGQGLVRCEYCNALTRIREDSQC